MTWPESEDVVGCSLPICKAHGDDAPVLYVPGRLDGAGSRMKKILDGIAVGFKLGMNFGGVVTRTPQHEQNNVSTHGHDFSEFMDDFFGPGAGKEMLKGALPSGTKMPDMEADTFDTSVLKGHSNVMLPIERWPELRASEDVYSPETIAKLTSYLLSKPPYAFPPMMLEEGERPPLQIAVHIRRGDLNFNAPRHVPDSWYLHWIERIRRVRPHSLVHLWSSTSQYWDSASFDAFRKAGVRVHLDDEKLVDCFAHFAAADVFLTSKSYFSYPGAVLSKGCVLWAGRVVASDERFSRWLDVSSSMLVSDQALVNCIKTGSSAEPPRATEL